MVVIQMPGGDLEYFAPGEFQWMRKAFDHEWSGTIMLRVAGNRIYSIESLDDLRRKFSEAEVGLAEFMAPEGEQIAVVNAKTVREVEPANPIIHHENARAVLKFAPRLSLAVRQTVEEARALLAAAGASAMGARRRIGTTGRRKVAAKKKTTRRNRTG